MGSKSIWEDAGTNPFTFTQPLWRAGHGEALSWGLFGIRDDHRLWPPGTHHSLCVFVKMQRRPRHSYRVVNTDNRTQTRGSQLPTGSCRRREDCSSCFLLRQSGMSGLSERAGFTLVLSATPVGKEVSPVHSIFKRETLAFLGNHGFT